MVFLKKSMKYVTQLIFVIILSLLIPAIGIGQDSGESPEVKLPPGEKNVLVTYMNGSITAAEEIPLGDMPYAIELRVGGYYTQDNSALGGYGSMIFHKKIADNYSLGTHVAYMKAPIEYQVGIGLVSTETDKETINLTPFVRYQPGYIYFDAGVGFEIQDVKGDSEGAQTYFGGYAGIGGEIKLNDEGSLALLGGAGFNYMPDSTPLGINLYIGLKAYLLSR